MHSSELFGTFKLY